jgi:phage tail tape-measure protein
VAGYPRNAFNRDEASRHIESTGMTIMITASTRFNHVRVKTSLAAAAFALLAMSASAQAQGVVRGAEEGFYTGGQALGPVGAVVGGAVGGVVGGVAGGVQGVLGIPQDTRTRAERVQDNRQVRVQRRRHHVQ